MDEAERLCNRVGIMDQGRIIALDTPRALIALLGAEHVIEFAAAEGQPAPDTEALRRVAGVRSVHIRDGHVQLHVEHLHAAVPAVLAELESQGVSLTELRTHSATLEDVFVSLTGRHLRDE
jgi:ABC-2 type transport system ATP-binding protein